MCLSNLSLSHEKVTNRGFTANGLSNQGVIHKANVTGINCPVSIGPGGLRTAAGSDRDVSVSPPLFHARGTVEPHKSALKSSREELVAVVPAGGAQAGIAL
jgi:hypothetical protein